MEIYKILDNVESLEMVMPEFQREYVWPIEDAKQLLVSLFRRYPTGSLLFWETENPPEIKNNAIDTSRLGLTKVILDGQQRLTTLYMLIKGNIPPYYTPDDILNDPRHLYVNLLNGEFQFYMRNLMEKNPVWQMVIDSFDESKVDAIDIAEQYCEINPDNDFREIMKVVNKNLTVIRGIRNIEYPILSVPKSASVNDAIEVFDRVNSKGTKLTDSDLVLTHFTGRWPQARRIMKKKLKQLEKEGFYLTLEFFTRCMVVTLTESALYAKNSKLKYDQFTLDDYQNAWQKVSKGVDYLIPILREDGLISSTNDLNTLNVLVPMIGYLVKNKLRFKGNLRFKYLYWMFMANMWSRYSGQTDQRLDKDIYIIYTAQDPVQGLLDEIKDQRGRLDVKPADLEGRGAGHPLYKMLYIITKSNKAIDWSNGGPIHGTIGDYYSIQSHHIFPQAYLYRNGFDSENHLDRKIVNEIANRAFITRDTNFSIGDKAPNEYLNKIEQEYPGALEKQFMPMDQYLWNAEKYENFLEERRQTISERINDFLSNLFEKEDKERFEPGIEESNYWFETIQKGESNFLEFKSTLRFCLTNLKPEKYIEFSIVKTINAFLNSEGGTLIVGVNDDGEVLGLENDLKTFGPKGKDGFLLHFDNMIVKYLGKEQMVDINCSFQGLNGHEVFVVEVSSSNKPIFLDKDGTMQFYVRHAASSQPYNMSEAFEYINKHWDK